MPIKVAVVEEIAACMAAACVAASGYVVLLTVATADAMAEAIAASDAASA